MPRALVTELSENMRSDRYQNISIIIVINTLYPE